MKYFIAILFSLGIYGFALGQNLQIIPDAKTDVTEIVGKGTGGVGSQGGKVWENYTKQAEELQKTKDLGAQMASGVFTWDTILDYLAYLIKFISEMGIFVGACFIVYAGYLYASSVFTSDSGATSKGNTAIKNAIIGVVVITFSYAIMKAITAAFLT